MTKAFEAECREFGLDPSKMWGKKHGPRQGPCIWPDMVDAFALFCAMRTQWNWLSLGVAGAMRTGLRYEVIDRVAAGLGIACTPDTFADIQTLEAAAMEAWSR